MAPGFEPLPVLMLVFLSIIIYIFPSIACFVMKSKHSTRIIIANIFVGWTIIGWFACLIYALSGPIEEAEDIE